jgi:hypothetical protein
VFQPSHRIMIAPRAEDGVRAFQLVAPPLTIARPGGSPVDPQAIA